MSEMIKIYSEGTNVLLNSENIEAVIIVEENTFSKDVLNIKMKSGDSYITNYNISDLKELLLERSVKYLKIYANAKITYINPLFIESIKRKEENTFSKDVLEVRMKSGDKYTINENLDDFQKRVKEA